jgi:acyl-CoA thioesterase-1
MKPVRRERVALLALAVALFGGACGSRAVREDERESAGARASATAPPQKSSSRASATVGAKTAARPRIAILGDSLTAGLGLRPSQAYPALLQQRLDDEGLEYDVVNAGVSGDTSAGGLARLDWALQGDVRILIVALGGNDALRALPADQLRDNLATVIERAQARGITVVLAGMEAPPNFGRDYIVGFHQVYPALAARYHVAFVPFLLAGVAGIDALNQPDGMHPTAAGARIVADNVWKILEPIAKEQRVEKRSGT